jgi:hypothetical protein
LKKILKSGKSFFVSPKESDEITSYFSELLADALTIAFAEGLR